MTEANARLIMRHGPQPNKEFPITQATTTIGRSHSTDVIIPDSEVSRRHAQIVKQGATFSIEDLGSTNGTFLNGQRITGLTPLNEDDLIDLGETVRLAFSLSLPGQPHESSLSDFSTSAAGPAPAAPAPAVTAPALKIEDAQAGTAGRSKRRRWMLGCGCALLLTVFLCGAALFFLDSYEGGRLLYCGPLQSVFETLLDPIGFSPPCAAP